MEATRRLRLTVAGSIAILLSIFCLHPAGLCLAATGADPGSLFVSPAGLGSACTQSAPCLLSTALAQAVDGDTVYLAAGAYTGAGTPAVVELAHSITVYCGWDGGTAVPPVRNASLYASVLDGENQRRGIHAARGLHVTVDCCTIVRGNATASDDPGRGGGIYVFDSVAVLAHNVISGNLGSGAAGQNGAGGGLYVSAANGSLLADNRVEHNVAAAQAKGFGGGIAIHGSAGIIVRDNVVLHNTASITNGLADGGGIYLSSSDYALVENNTIESNIAQNGWYPDTPAEAGGLFLDFSAGVTVTGNTIRNNVASVSRLGIGGAISMDHIDRSLVRGNLVQGNMGCSGGGECSGYGGALYAYESWLVSLEANRFLDNVASLGAYGAGGALYLCRDSTFTVTNNLIAGNHAAVKGGGLTFESELTDPVTATLLHNTWVNNNGGESVAGKAAIFIPHPGVTLHVVNSIFSGHSYGVLDTGGSTITLDHNLFHANTFQDAEGEHVVNTAPIHGDPLLNATYHLGAGSPAIDAGVPAGVDVDMDGDPRPLGARVDIGADEYVSAPPVSVYLPLMMRRWP